MSTAIRSAEKSRVSTCSLADEVAAAVIERYRSFSTCNDKMIQSVLSGIVVIQQNTIEVVAIGMGNKFVQHDIVSNADEIVKDCHAEILARRAFKLWLIQQREAMLRGQMSTYFSPVNMAVLEGVKFVLYVSSAPCGSACVRRWAKTGKEPVTNTVNKWEIPKDIHEAYFPHAKHEGQSAISFKGGSEGQILSCSDKILKWSVVGIQGTRLSSLVVIKLDGIVIGRKFAKKHAMRAFCCRLATKTTPLLIRNALTHPSLMCTSVKFDDGTFIDGNGATFSHVACWSSCGQTETLDGSQGLVILNETKRVSQISSTNLQAKTHACKIPPPNEAHLELARILKLELIKL